jgi:hypothetical protein
MHRVRTQGWFYAGGGGEVVMAILDKVLSEVTKLIDCNQMEAAIAALNKDFPFVPVERDTRNYTPLQSTKLFVRDGFIDRYTGAKLVFPGALRLMAELMPHDFPFHRNWRTDATHPAFWTLFPTVDHLVPIASGGEDTESNWVTTSMMKNSAKGHWSLEDLGWNLHPPGDMSSWDGLTEWFREYYESHPEPQDNKYLKTWYQSLVRSKE